MQLDYWNRYYSERSAPIRPSQFAVFVLGEMNPDVVLDIGCGSGRDSFWFASQGFKTIGVDGSQAAVDMCSERANGHDNLSFVRADVGDPSLPETLLGQFAGAPLIYARFFLHAINDSDQSMFLQHATKILAERGGSLAVEYRTVRDQALSKATAEHYRRFIEPAHLVADATRHGLTCRYCVEGFGFAKYKSDDAYVSRMIFERAS